MKSFLFVVVMFVSSIFCTAAYSRTGMTKERCNKAQSFVGMTQLETETAKLSVDAGHLAETATSINNLESTKIQAIKATTPVPSLEDAMKDFVVTAREYLESIEPKTDEMRITYGARSAALQTRMDRASEKVDTELQLACPSK